MENNFRNKPYDNRRDNRGDYRGDNRDRMQNKKFNNNRGPNGYMGNNKNMMNDYNQQMNQQGQQLQYYTIQQTAPVIQTADGSQMMISYSNTPPGQYQLIQGQNGQLIMINPATNAPVDPNQQGAQPQVEGNPQVVQQQQQQKMGNLTPVPPV